MNNPEEKYQEDIKERLDKSNAIQINIYLSRVVDKLYVALDGIPFALTEFGITYEQFHELGIAINDACQKVLNES